MLSADQASKFATPGMRRWAIESIAAAGCFLANIGCHAIREIWDISKTISNKVPFAIYVHAVNSALPLRHLLAIAGMSIFVGVLSKGPASDIDKFVGGHAGLFAGDALDFGAVAFWDRAARWRERLRARGEPECRSATWASNTVASAATGRRGRAATEADARSRMRSAAVAAECGAAPEQDSER